MSPRTPTATGASRAGSTGSGSIGAAHPQRPLEAAGHVPARLTTNAMVSASRGAVMISTSFSSFVPWVRLRGECRAARPRRHDAAS